MLSCSILVWGVMSVELLLIKKYDHLQWSIKSKVPVLLCLLAGFCVSGIGGIEKLCLCVIAGCFLTAAVTDYYTCQVYRFIWWIAFGANLVSLLYKSTQTDFIYLQELIIFCLLQELGFAKMYGRADCHGFCVGALTLFCYGGNMWDFLMQMVYAFGMLLIVQAFRKNINRRGNLKRPVAFLPYITVSFWLVLMEKEIKLSSRLIGIAVNLLK